MKCLMWDVRKREKVFFQVTGKMKVLTEMGEKQERSMFWGEHHFSFSHAKFERRLSGDVDLALVYTVCSEEKSGLEIEIWES